MNLLPLVGAIPIRLRWALAGVMALALAAVMLGPPAFPVQAQESGTKQVQVRADPYDITVVAALSNLSLGKVKFFITVLDAATGMAVTDAIVVVRPKHAVDGTRGWATALYVPSPPEHYEAQVTLDKPGTWMVAVAVTSSLGSEEIVAPTLEVPDTRSYTSGSIVFAGVFVVLLLGAGYVWWSVRRIQRRRPAIDTISEGGQDGGPDGQGP